ncbi:hypothetical protein [Manganibacter manganicus]|uniref:Uncharacterized protein n=1 Tax=Manganibacter manganicus TaxID=1873176 RepID=A0A1V8RPV9_9HYPH|nr:hypothetical protein [Pseudaminobacter manganicus]OQM75241.1 hypothetical protein BFN67_18950 [Pseudaminobacter manganicus]
MSFVQMTNLRERAARALCRKAGHAEDIIFDGKPAWAWFLSHADAVFEVIGLARPGDQDLQGGAGI